MCSSIILKWLDGWMKNLLYCILKMLLVTFSSKRGFRLGTLSKIMWPNQLKRYWRKWELMMLLFQVDALNTPHKKWSFPLRIFLVNFFSKKFPADLVSFTEKIRNGKLHFLCSDTSRKLMYFGISFLKAGLWNFMVNR